MGLFLKKLEKYLCLWYVSFLFLALGILFFILFLFHHNWIVLVLFILFLGLFSIFYGTSNKKLETDAPFSVPQSISFYNACTRAGHKGGYSAKENRIVKQLAAKRDYLKKEPDAIAAACYRAGKQTVESAKNPFLRTLWYIKSGEFKLVR